MFEIISDSACDLSDEYVNTHNISIVPFYISFDEEHYYKDKIEMKRDTFYDKLVLEGLFPKTSLPSVEDYINVFTPFVVENKPLICVCISTSLSGSFNSASTARDILMEDYPNAKITVINSKQNTASQALLVNEIVRMKEDGLDYDTTVSKLNALCNSGMIFFTVGSLDYLRVGGRIGKLATIATGKLGIKPIIIMRDGEITSGGVGRNRSKLLKSIIRQVGDYIEKSGLSKDSFNINMGMGYDPDEAAEFLKDAEENIGIRCDADTNVLIGPTSACHTGPYSLGLAIIRRYETL